MKLIRRLVWLVVMAAVAFAVFLGVEGGKNTVVYDEDVAIVLGGGIACGADEAARPKEVLKRRLDKAVEYHGKNPKAKIIVSGGNEKNKCETEAEVMKKYLIEHNVPENLILVEDRATSTEENFRFSREIMQANGLSHAVVITSRSHMYRAIRTAQRVGISAKQLAASEPWYIIPLNYGYEVFQTVMFFVNPPKAVEVE
jgi:uncharacterized SAM-binding protein YcdF (DUF218 family)